MIKLREDQLEIVKYRGGRMAVPSVAGAGKTTTIAMLVKELVEDGSAGDGKILIVTYMNSAVANFKSRINGFLSESGLGNVKNVEVMTLHSLASKIIRDKCDSIGFSGDFDVIDDGDRANLIKNAADFWAGKHRNAFKEVLERENKYEDFKNKFYDIVLRMISYFKSIGYSHRDLAGIVSRLPEDSMLRWCIEIYGEYTIELNRRSQMDYDDLILSALKVLERDDGVRGKFQNRWVYIFEDEAQDSNPLQEKILSILSDDNKNLVRVGDSNQAIMSTFTSSTPSLFRSFTRRDDVEKKVLKFSNRNSKDIIDMANYLVEFSNSLDADLDIGMDDRLEKQMICPVEIDGKLLNPCPDGYFVGGKAYETKDAELKGVCRMAWGEADRNPDKTIAILVRSNGSMNDVCAYLKELGAQYEELSAYPEERAKTVKIVGKVLDYLLNPDNPRKLIDAVNYIYFDNKMGNRMSSYLTSGYIEDILIPEDRRKLNGELEMLGSPGEAEKLKIALYKFSDLVLSADRPLEEIIMSIAEAFDFDREMVTIAQRIAYEVEVCKRHDPMWDAENLIGDLKSNKGTYRYFANVVYDRHGFEPKPGIINICTYHKAKGLEWDTVFLTSLTKSQFPNRTGDRFLGELWYLKEAYRNPEARMKWEFIMALGEGRKEDPMEAYKKEVIAESLRLLYVGITRAKEKLFFSANRKEWSETEESLYFRVLNKIWNERRMKNEASGS